MPAFTPATVAAARTAGIQVMMGHVPDPAAFAEAAGHGVALMLGPQPASSFTAAGTTDQTAMLASTPSPAGRASA